MIDFLKKMFGLKDKVVSVAEQLLPPVPVVEEIKKTPKEIATENKDPWVAVMDTHVNKDNIRNGFFELDWNEYFVLQLRTNGYQGDTEESVVDQWFQDLCRNIGSEADINMDRRGSGYINVNNLGNGKSEIS